jgi:hypothetical protein
LQAGDAVLCGDDREDGNECAGGARGYRQKWT